MERSPDAIGPSGEIFGLKWWHDLPKIQAHELKTTKNGASDLPPTENGIE
jgi:hypothetical protein